MIEDKGGALALIKDGLGRRLMTEGAVRRQKAIDGGRRPWVTVNLWPQKPNVPNTAFRIDPASAAEQVARLRRVRVERDGARVDAALKAVRAASESGANVVPAVLEAVRAYATVGEIVEVWRDIFGHFTPSTDF
jgi:methylmalonyl-CoA mutase N-terminal domain/subunit